jgi:hypothetical protein
MRHGTGGWSTDPNAMERWRPRQVNGHRYGATGQPQDDDLLLSMFGLLVAAVLLTVWWLIRHRWSRPWPRRACGSTSSTARGRLPYII